MAAVAPGTAVWFDHPVERWVPATVAEAGSKSLSVTVDLESLRGETREPTEGAPERHTMKAGKGAEEAGLVGAESQRADAAWKMGSSELRAREAAEGRAAPGEVRALVLAPTAELAYGFPKRKRR